MVTQQLSFLRLLTHSLSFLICRKSKDKFFLVIFAWIIKSVDGTQSTFTVGRHFANFHRDGHFAYNEIIELAINSLSLFHWNVNATVEKKKKILFSFRFLSVCKRGVPATSKKDPLFFLRCFSCSANETKWAFQSCPPRRRERETTRGTENLESGEWKSCLIGFVGK